MKPANLARCAVWLATVATPACGASAPPTPPTIAITETGRSAARLPAPEPKPLAVAGPSLSGLTAVRDERLAHRAPRPTALLITEIQGLESMLAATPRESPDRPKLMMRVVQGYVELERAGATSGTLEHATKLVGAARATAIKYYQLMAEHYPQWCATPGSATLANGAGCGDEVFYYLGLEAERAGQLDVARRSYLELLQRFPQSRFVPAAYLAFGEMFVAEAERDPSKLTLVEQSFDEVVKYPPPDNHVFGLAQYRLAQLYAKKGDPSRALAHLDKATDYATQYRDATGLAEAAEHLRAELGGHAPDPGAP